MPQRHALKALPSHSLLAVAGARCIGARACRINSKRSAGNWPVRFQPPSQGVARKFPATDDQARIAIPGRFKLLSLQRETDSSLQTCSRTGTGTWRDGSRSERGCSEGSRETTIRGREICRYNFALTAGGRRWRKTKRDLAFYRGNIRHKGIFLFCRARQLYGGRHRDGEAAVCA